MRASIRNVIKKLWMSDHILMLSHPAQEYVIGMLNERCICYDLYDEHSESRVTSSKIRKLVKGEELKILNKADVIFTSARNLYETKKVINPNTHFVPNAADVKFFMKSMEADTKIPPDILKIPEPRIGLIGNINDIVDMDLLVYIAEQKPDWSIILIGNINGSPHFLKSQSFSRCKKLSNIHIMGFRNYETLPSYQKGLDVCLLPYLINEYTLNVYPNKVHQYLAGGKPVVSTDLPEMRPFVEVVDITINHDDFLDHVEKALINDNAIISEKRIKIAIENSVEKRAELKVLLLNEVLNGK
ncbi:MAG: glycosyltransferase group 1 [Candidatus Scalindua rubra]|uniref:Glycosyltransferase group 1 n=1 Tax=Candidatus Scalindua rubra TaxID=1872076 RepID=A0A1E3X2W7_9BACT|nr:MAG: glycosyltransferase group 1 [Candidatus Scalindua rubra]